ncbi:MAG: GTPase Era, partial [Pseudanabaenaceae cyanobacterium]
RGGGGWAGGVGAGAGPGGGGARLGAPAMARAGTPAVVGVNKVDLDRAGLDSYGAIAQAQGWPLLAFSALTGEGVPDLLAACLARLPEGPCYFPPDALTDRPERFVMGELIREQVLLLTREEVPHSVAVAIDRVVEEPKLTRVLATIVVERSSQKAILIGAKGQMLKEIGSRARGQMQALLGTKVFLELFVKVVPKWRASPRRLADLGYVPE